jgi:hypothetical protein
LRIDFLEFFRFDHFVVFCSPRLAVAAFRDQNTNSEFVEVTSVVARSSPTCFLLLQRNVGAVLKRRGTSMARAPMIGVAATAVISFSIPMAQGQEHSTANVALAPSTIEYIPPLAQAVLDGDQKQVSEVIKEAPDSINEPVRSKKGSRAGYTPLILAAALSEPKIASILIRGGAKITVLDDYNRSAIWYAAFLGDAEVTQVLFEAPAVSDVVNAADSDFKRTPLHLALRNNNSNLVYRLVKAGASKEQKDVLGETPLDYCKHAQTSSCKELQ